MNDNMHPTLLIATLGTGRSRTDVASAVAFSCRQHQAGRLVLLCSAKTLQETAPEVRALLPDVEIAAEACPDGMERNVQHLLLHWNGRWDALIAPADGERVVVDFTSGTKPMSAAAFALALSRGADVVSYVTGPSDDTGRATACENVIHFAPDLVIAHRQLRQAADYFNAGSYAAARDLAEPLTKLQAVDDDQLRTIAVGIHHIAAAYEAWDRFDWKQAAHSFHQVSSKWNEWTWVETPDQLRANHQHVQQVNKGKTSLATCLLADLLANARRCMARRAWDDAVARLYRACEMIAQKRLADGYGQNSGKINPEALPAGLQKEYRERLARSPTGKLSLGLEASYRLLAELDDPLGREFFQHYGQDRKGPLGTLLNQRNQSLLAHGEVPVKQDKAQPLEAHILALARIHWAQELDEILPAADSVRLVVT